MANSLKRYIDPKTFGRPSIALALFGCTNRPFYQIVVFPDKSLGRYYSGNIIEQVNLQIFIFILPEKIIILVPLRTV